MFAPTLESAIQTYQDRKSRLKHPDGAFDRKQRWYPSTAEEQPCCRGIRGPSARYPYSLMLHCRTVEHIAQLHGVNSADLRLAVRAQTTQTRQGGDHYYKAVAVVDGRYWSIYDGTTEYVLGQERRETAYRNHAGGFYVYASVESARRADVPWDSRYRDMPRAILRCQVGGKYCVYEEKLAFSRITPLEVIDD